MEFSPFLIPIVAMCIPILAIILKHREKVEQIRIEAGRNAAVPDASRQDGRMEMLEDRVAVLERIITDRGYDVATQIEALRDQRQVEERAETRNAERSY